MPDDVALVAALAVVAGVLDRGVVVLAVVVAAPVRRPSSRQRVVVSLRDKSFPRRPRLDVCFVGVFGQECFFACCVFQLYCYFRFYGARRVEFFFLGRLDFVASVVT